MRFTGSALKLPAISGLGIFILCAPGHGLPVSLVAGLKERDKMKSIVITLLSICMYTLLSTPAMAVPVLQASLGYPIENHELSMCSLGCAIGWHVQASSTLAPRRTSYYVTDNISDYDTFTAWIAGDPQYGVGETISFTFTKEDFAKANIGEKINVNGFLVVNGYHKTEKTWKENTRVKRILISHNSKPLYEALLHDNMNIQEISFENVWLAPDDKVTVKILEVYPGAKYKNTAISELIPLGAH